MTELAIRGLGGLWQSTHAIRQFLSSGWVLVVLLPLAVLAIDPANFNAIVTFAAKAFLSTLPYIVIACLMIAYLKASGAEGVIARAFEGRETRMIILAALLGGLAPFCSCEVIPFIAGLLAVGAPLSAVMAFWLSSPLMDPAAMFITVGALGWTFAISKAVAAVAMGLIGGFAMRGLMATGMFADPLRPRTAGGCCKPSTSCGSGSQPAAPVWRFWTERKRVTTFRNEGMSNGLFLVKWLALAYILEALLVTYVPAEAIAQVVGGQGLLPIVIGAVVGAPAYLNSYAAPPLVAGLMEQGMSSGAAMAFMIAGGVSSIPAMAAVWSLVKREVFVAYMAFGIGGAVICGVVFSLVF
ncbi:MAG: permease [Pseudomonadota bacterium]